MKTPKTPEGWATRVTTVVEAVSRAHGLPLFPIDVKEVAKGYSQQVFPKEAIEEIGSVGGGGFEGMLLPIPNRNGAWGLIYRESKSIGRENFSVAHEFGHYLLHRQKYPEGKKCTNRDMLDWTSEEAQIEGEANRFAANLLMPLDDFRREIGQNKVDFDLFDKLTARYRVSLAAAILRWLDFTDQRAMIVVGCDGFVDWAWSSKPLLKSGIFLRPRRETIELPTESLAAKRDPHFDNKTGVLHPPGVWPGDESVKEMTVLSEDYGNMSISLLRYPSRAGLGYYFEEAEEEDLVDRFSRR